MRVLSLINCRRRLEEGLIQYEKPFCGTRQFGMVSAVPHHGHSHFSNLLPDVFSWCCALFAAVLDGQGWRPRCNRHFATHRAPLALQ